MKPYIPIIVIVGLVVVALATSIFTADALESPKTKLGRQIDEQVEFAQRMLADYNPAVAGLQVAMESAATKPAAAPEADKWRENLKSAEQEGAFAELLQKQNRELRRLAEQVSRLDGSEVVTVTLPSAEQAFRELPKNLEANRTRIQEALRAIQKAISLSEGSGENEVRGDMDPAATRMEAALIYHQADLLRRESALYQAIDDVERSRVAELATSFDTIASRIDSLKQELAVSPTAVTKAPAVTEPEPKQEPEPKPAKPGTGKPGALGKLLGKLTGGLEKTQPESAPAQPVQDEEPATVAKSQAPDKAVKVEAVPSLPERIAALKTRRQEVTGQIDDAKAEVERLAAATADIKERIAAARQEATEAESAMIKMEQAGIDPSAPEDVKPFSDKYASLSAVYRKASREAAILESGAIRNARPDTDDEDKMLAAPLVKADEAKEMRPERGLVALESDLRAAEGLVETNAILLNTIDVQIADLTARQGEVQARIDRLVQSQENLTKATAESARRAIAVAIKTGQLDADGIELATNQGSRAAQRAKRAADQRISDARNLNADNAPEAQNPRLELISRGQFVSGYAQLLAGDMNYIVAMIQAQRADQLDRHAEMLAKLEQLNITVQPDLLPEGSSPDTVPGFVYDAKQAKAEADKARTLAAEEAIKALEVYNEADSAVNNIWVLHANMAAVHYLLAGVTEGKDAQGHRDNARKEYQRAIKNRTDRPEYEDYARILDELSKSRG